MTLRVAAEVEAGVDVPVRGDGAERRELEAAHFACKEPAAVQDGEAERALQAGRDSRQGAARSGGAAADVEAGGDFADQFCGPNSRASLATTSGSALRRSVARSK
ncbi:hypothetical protein [Amycolatopsis sp.]|uniref:hypothetical protein n=1 Tax=Amycolatopsis sp. TaxID=37632 RepID=UPI002D7F5F45|nr:hypothetical protein [Amycolatopsis sp.]HET6708163.1 hypothetical protein [Amycolatopsis sp.]